MTVCTLQPFVDQLSAHTNLTEEEKLALLELPVTTHWISNDEVVAQQGKVAQSSCIVLNGLLARGDYGNDGTRQIISFFVSGDMPDLQTLFRPKATFGLRAVCSSQIARIAHTALLEAMRCFAGIGEAFARQLARDGDIASEWVVNLGKRTARKRLAHLFCEMAVKTKKDSETKTEFRFPVTQTILGDAAGLSTVHVNRSLQSLRQQGVLNFENGDALIPDWKALAEVAEFDRAYLEAETPMRRLSPDPLPTYAPS